MAKELNSKMQEFQDYYKITNEEMEQHKAHYEYHFKDKVNNETLSNFFKCVINTHKIQANDPEEFAKKFYAKKIKSTLKSKLFKHTDSSSILKLIDFNKIFEDLYEEYHISYFMLDDKKPEFFYTSKTDEDDF